MASNPIRLLFARAGMLAFILSPSVPAMAVQWTEIGASASWGGVSNSAGVESSFPSVACDSSGFPIVAWGEAGKIKLKRWNGLEWVGMGGTSDGDDVSVGAGSSSMPSLAVDSTGTPVVAWRGVEGSQYQIFVRRWGGAAWIPFGTPGTGGRIATDGANATLPCLAMDGNDRPVVAWQEEYAYVAQIQLMRWNGSDWTPQGGAAGPQSVSNAAWSAKWPSMALDPAGLPVVAWENAEQDENIFGNRQIFVRRWDVATSGWLGIGGSDDPEGISNTQQIAARPALAVDRAGHPVVAWLNMVSGSSRCYVKGWDGTAWAGFGDSATGAGLSSAGTVYFLDRVRSVAIALDSSGLPTVAWIGGPVPINVRLLRWRNGGWNEIDGSMTGQGISNSVSICFNPCLAYNAYDDLFAAWNSTIFSGGNGEVYLRAVIAPTPAISSPPDQLRLDGVTPIPIGGLVVEESGFVAVLPVSDPDSRTVEFDLEVRPVEDTFTGIPTCSGGPGPTNTTLTFAVTGLDLDRSYHWRVRIRLGSRSLPWVSFGGNLESSTDFRLRNNAAPGISALVQIGSFTDGLVATGAPLVGDEGATFRGIVSDSDGDEARIEVEALPLELPFTGAQCYAGSLVPSGSTAYSTAMLGAGPYHWRARAVDQYGKGSGWTAFGGNGETEADFIVKIWGGSVNPSACSQSMLPLPGPAVVLPFLLVLAFAAGRSRARPAPRR